LEVLQESWEGHSGVQVSEETALVLTHISFSSFMSHVSIVLQHNGEIS
jgi:hypothetical protein